MTFTDDFYQKPDDLLVRSRNPEARSGSVLLSAPAYRQIPIDEFIGTSDFQKLKDEMAKQGLVYETYTFGANEEIIKEEMMELKKKNYINDVMFTESYIRSEVINKGKPAIRVIQKLYQK